MIATIRCKIHCNKFRVKIRYILGYTKMENFELLKKCTVHRTQILTFVIFAETKIQRILD
jgi:hypothetical protein